MKFGSVRRQSGLTVGSGGAFGRRFVVFWGGFEVIGARRAAKSRAGDTLAILSYR